MNLTIRDTGILKSDPYVLVDENEHVLAASYEQNGEHTKAGLQKLVDELATLRAQLEDAKRVIEPFASESDMWGSKTPDTETPIIKGSDGKGDEAAFTVGDLRAAAAWYQKVTTA